MNSKAEQTKFKINTQYNSFWNTNLIESLILTIHIDKTELGII